MGVAPAMMQCSGTDFSIDVPDGTIDSSSYLYVLPIESTMTPNVLITKRLVEQSISAAQAMQDRIAELTVTLPGIEFASKLEGQRDTRDYAMFMARWQADAVALQQKTMLLHFNATPTEIFILTVTSLVEDYAAAEKIFDQMVRDFAHKPLQSASSTG